MAAVSPAKPADLKHYILSSGSIQRRDRATGGTYCLGSPLVAGMGIIVPALGIIELAYAIQSRSEAARLSGCIKAHRLADELAQVAKTTFGR